MPPRKNSRKQSSTVNGKQSGNSLGSPASRKRVCDGCTDTISATTDALQCSMCQVWLHRYCAGVPTSRYAAIAPSFVCSACSITASASIVSELRSEIAALKAEMFELKTALNVANQKLELHVQKVASTEMQIAQSQQRYSNRRFGSNVLSSHKARPPKASHASSARAVKGTYTEKSYVAVQGKRKLWGTRKITNTEDVIQTINSHTNVKTGLTIKRKYKSSPRQPHTTSKWWFVIIGEENLLQQLQGEWSKVKSQTEGKWSLEPLLCYNPESASSNQPDATLPTNVPMSPIPHQESEPTMSCTPRNIDTNDPPASANMTTSPDQNQLPKSNSFLETTTKGCSPNPPQN